LKLSLDLVQQLCIIWRALDRLEEHRNTGLQMVSMVLTATAEPVGEWSKVAEVWMRVGLNREEVYQDDRLVTRQDEDAAMEGEGGAQLLLEGGSLTDRSTRFRSAHQRQ
jgi:hypothetical protein